MTHRRSKNEELLFTFVMQKATEKEFTVFLERSQLLTSRTSTYFQKIISYFKNYYARSIREYAERTLTGDSGLEIINKLDKLFLPVLNEQQLLLSLEGNFQPRTPITLNEEAILLYKILSITTASIFISNKVKFNNKMWEVQAIDTISTPGIIEVALKETSNNTPKDDIEKAVVESIDIVHVDERQEEYIHGPVEVYPYETHSYELKNSSLHSGTWAISNESRKNSVKITAINETCVDITIMTGKSATFQLDFITGERTVSLPIEIKSL